MLVDETVTSDWQSCLIDYFRSPNEANLGEIQTVLEKHQDASKILGEQVCKWFAGMEGLIEISSQQETSSLWVTGLPSHALAH